MLQSVQEMLCQYVKSATDVLLMSLGSTLSCIKREESLLCATAKNRETSGTERWVRGRTVRRV